MEDFKLRVDNSYLGTVLDSLPRLDEGGADAWNKGVDMVRDALSKLDIGLDLGNEMKGVGMRVNVCEPIRELVRQSDKLDYSLWDDGRVELVRGCIGLMVELEYICTRRDDWSGFLDYVKNNGGVINLNRAIKDGFKNVSGSLYRLFQRFSGNSSVRRMYCYDLFKALVAREMELKHGSKVNVKYHGGFYVAPGRGRKGQSVSAVLRGVDSMATRSREGQKHMWAAVRALQARVSKCLNEAVTEKNELADSLAGVIKRLKEVDEELAAVGRDKDVIAWREQRLELERHLEAAKQALAALTRRKPERFELSGRYMREYKGALRKLESRMPKSLRGVPKLEDEKAVLEKKKARLEGQVADLEEQLVPARVLEEGVKGLPASVDEARQGVKRAVRDVVEPEAQTKRRQKRRQPQGKPKVQAENGGVAIKTLGDLKANLGAKVVVTVTEKGLVHFEKNSDGKRLPEVGSVLDMEVVRESNDRFYSLRGGGRTVVVSREYVLRDLSPRLVGAGSVGRPARRSRTVGDGDSGKSSRVGDGDVDAHVGSGEKKFPKTVQEISSAVRGDDEEGGDDGEGDGRGGEDVGDGDDDAAADGDGDGSNRLVGKVIEQLGGLRACVGMMVLVKVTDDNLKLFKKNAEGELDFGAGDVIRLMIERGEGQLFCRLVRGSLAVVVSQWAILKKLSPRIAAKDEKETINPVISRVGGGKPRVNKPDVGGLAHETAGEDADFNVVITDMKGLRSLEGMEAIVTVTNRNLALLKRGALSANALQIGRNLRMEFKLAELGGSVMRLVGEGCAVALVSDGVLAMLQPRIRRQSVSSRRASGRRSAVVAGAKGRLVLVDSGNGVPRRGELKSLVDGRGLSFFNNDRHLFHVAGCLAEDYDENGVGMSSQEVADALQMAAGDVKTAINPLRGLFSRLGLVVKVKAESNDVVIELVPSQGAS